MKPVVLIALILLMAVCACRKAMPQDANLRTLSNAPDGPPRRDSVVTKPDTSVVPTPPFPQHTVDSLNNTPSDPGGSGGSGNSGGSQAPAGTGCSFLPIYGDTLVFPQPSSGDYFIQPVNAPGPGKYFSWPVGMVLDQNTGAINATKSQTGMRYILGFVKQGTTDTCLSTLIIGGAAYYDSVYVFENGATTAPPYFEANPWLPSVCANGGCTFDVTGSAAAQKVIVDPATGVIDLQKTLNGTGLLGGAFGLLPVNGQTLTTTIFYRINYGSNNALQQIQVQLMYYDRKALISGGLLGGVVNALDNVLSGNVISTSANPRPPLVIMTRRN
jgi:hypothetical protein